MKYPQTFPFYFSERWWDELSVLAAVLPMRSDIKILIAALAGVWDRNMVLTLPPPTPAIHISDHGFFHQTDHRRARYQTFILYGEGGRHTMRSKLHTMRTERVKQPVSYFLRLWKWMIGGVQLVSVRSARVSRSVVCFMESEVSCRICTRNVSRLSRGSEARPLPGGGLSLTGFPDLQFSQTAFLPYHYPLVWSS